MDIIQQLKANEKPFGLMSAEMQKKAMEIEHGAGDWFQWFDGSGWGDVANINLFALVWAYRLRKKYEEKPEIEECKIYGEKGNLVFTKKDISHGIDMALRHPDFIGFKFEDGHVANGPISYASETNKYDFVHLDQVKNGHFTVLHATHVLFRGKN